VAHLEKVMSNSSSPKSYSKANEGRVLDIVFGVIPAFLVGIFCVLLMLYLVSSINIDFVRLLFILALFGMLSCIFLIISIFQRESLNHITNWICCVVLSIGIVVAIVSFYLLATLFKDNPNENSVFIAIPFILDISLILSAFRQIRLLRS
jgi:hypothetical protein